MPARRRSNRTHCTGPGCQTHSVRDPLPRAHGSRLPWQTACQRRDLHSTQLNLTVERGNHSTGPRIRKPTVGIGKDAIFLVLAPVLFQPSHISQNYRRNPRWVFFATHRGYTWTPIVGFQETHWKPAVGFRKPTVGCRKPAWVSQHILAQQALSIIVATQYNSTATIFG